MGAKGSILKKEIAAKILETFPDSFLYNDGKEIRINGMEEGQCVQIKVSLTAAKVAVENENSGISSGSDDEPVKISNAAAASEKIPQEPSDEEKERLAMLLNKLGL